jgi:hypothetical protein
VKEIFDGLGAALAREYGSHRWIINLKGVPFKNEVRFVSMGCCGLAFEFAVRDGRVVRVPADDEVIAQQMRKKHTGYIFDLTPMVVNRKTRWISAGGFYDKKRSEAFEYMLDESSGKFVEVGPSQELLAGLLRKDFNGNQLSSMKFYDQGGRGHVVAVGSEASVHEYVYSPDERMMTRVIRGGSKSLGEASRSTIRESEIRKFIEVPTRNAGRRFLVMTMANEAVNVFGQDRDDAAKSSSDDAMISDAGLLGAKGGVDFNLTKVDFEVQKPESSPFYTGRIHMQSADGSTAIASIVPIILEATPVQQR